MNLNLTDEQRMIRDSVRDYFANTYDFPAHLKRIELDSGLDRQRWSQMAELGWLGLCVPQECGGVGGGPEEAMLLLEGAGGALCIEPLMSTCVLVAPMLAQAAPSGTAHEVLQLAMEGKVSLALACWESHHGFDPLAVNTVAVKEREGRYLLTGRKVLVDNGGNADWIVIPARTGPGGPQARGRISLFLVPGNAPGLSRTSVPMVDGARSADLTLESVAVEASQLIGAEGEGADLLLRAVYRGLAANCAECVGAMHQAVEICRQYMQERKQFGKSLADFQALQHRFVDLLIAEERARSMTMLAAIRASEGVLEPEVLRDIHLAKVVVGRGARFVGAQAIQLHGGMGMAYEYPIGHYYRKLLSCESSFGTADDHLMLLHKGSHETGIAA